MRILLAILISCVIPCSGLAAPQRIAPLRPGRAIDYGELAFEPQVWREQGVPLRMLTWSGKEVVFLTLPDRKYDGQQMRRWVERLDGGWRVYRELVGEDPRPLKIWDDKPVIAAVPDPRFTCGAGCGYVGHTGIELALFYDHDLPRLGANPAAMPHYVFYEMGRNFYVFGDRHSCFTTGFAVFMRYVCMDALELEDEDRATRETIEKAEGLVAAGELSFLRAFTNAGGLDEKEPRCKDAEGQPIHPTDQPVVYASAMLHLQRTLGGNDWLKRFYEELRRFPEAPPDTQEGALQQGRAWYAAASLAAERDLRADFVGRWRLPLTTEQHALLDKIDWRATEAARKRLDGLFRE